MTGDNCITYRIDRDGNIVFISDNWDQFASSNKGANLVKNLVLNKPLFGFISDWETRHLYELLIASASKRKRNIKFPYRCDAPGKRRYMTMEIIALKNGLTEFRSCVDKEQSRPAQPLLDVDAARSDELLLICAWCKKVNSEGDQWEEIEEVVNTKNIFNAAMLPRLTHGVCPACLGKIKAKISNNERP